MCGVVAKWGEKKAQQARLAREREAVQLMRRLKVGAEELHDLARRYETLRPEKGPSLFFDLSRQAFQLHKTMRNHAGST